jgi:hypothetical protein
MRMMQCSLKIPRKRKLGGLRSVDLGGHIPFKMITERERKAVASIILALSMGCISF